MTWNTLWQTVEFMRTRTRTNTTASVLILGIPTMMLLSKVATISVHYVTLVMRLSSVNSKVLTLQSKTKRRQSFLGTSFQQGSIKDMKRRVLIVHASVGAGHKRAAEGVEKALRQDYPTAELKVVDIMDEKIANHFFIYMYKTMYLKMVSGTTVLGSMGSRFIAWGFDRSNNVQEGKLTGGGFLDNRHFSTSMVLNFLEMLCEFEPDLVIHTHFLAPEIIAGLRRSHLLSVPQFTVVTDMGVHAWWYQQPTEHYFVPRALAQYELERFGVPSEDITATGIPVLPAFAETVKAIAGLAVGEKRARFRSKMDVEAVLWKDTKDNRPVIMVMSTGGGIVELFKAVIELKTPSIVVVVCGRQADVRAELAAIIVPSHHSVQLLGFTKTIHELMAVADVIVTKPGGLITSESLACGLMMVIVDQYPGQEEWNTAMLLSGSAAIQVFKYRTLAFQLDPIVGDLGRLQSFKDAARAMGRPDAAHNVVKKIMSQDVHEIKTEMAES